MKYPYLTVALLVIFGIIDIGILGNHYELTKSDWSGWVQAIGSVAALGVAIFVMSRQNEHSARLILQADQMNLRRRAEAISVLMENAHWQIKHCLGKVQAGLEKMDLLETKAAFTSAKHFMGDVHRTLASIPLHDLGSADMTDGILRINQVASVVIATSEMELTIERFAGLKPMTGALVEKADYGMRIFRKGIAMHTA